MRCAETTEKTRGGGGDRVGFADHIPKSRRGEKGKGSRASCHRGSSHLAFLSKPRRDSYSSLRVFSCIDRLEGGTVAGQTVIHPILHDASSEN